MSGEFDLEEEYKVVDQEVTKYLSNVSGYDNIYRRKLYSRIELLKLDVEEVQERLVKSDRCEKLLTQLSDLAKKVPLIPIKRASNLFTQLEIIVRFLGVATMFILSGSLLSLPILFLRVIDISLQNNPFNYYSEKLKKFMLFSFLLLSGIELRTENIHDEDFSVNNRVLLSFTHASNLDGFLVAYTCPIRQVAFGKKELFTVPFFAWISLAIGGIPVDRGNRERAVSALKMSVNAAKQSSNLVVAIAPEGTRSTTGQLLPYKKGAFYLAEDLSAPIVPLLIFGAYDLYPVGNWVNLTGVITVRYLNPIYFVDPQHPTDVLHQTQVGPNVRAQFLRKVRRETLLSLADAPTSIGQDVSVPYRLLSFLSNVLVVLFAYFLGLWVYTYLSQTYHLSIWGVLGVLVGVTLCVTATLYVYYVYVIHLFSSSSGSSSSGSSSSSQNNSSDNSSDKNSSSDKHSSKETKKTK